MLADLKLKKFVSSDLAKDHICCFNSKGGVLADAAGLGKTLESKMLLNFCPEHTNTLSHRIDAAHSETRVSRSPRGWPAQY